MDTTFQIGYEWIPCEYGDVAEQSTVAALTILVGRYCATEVEDILARSVRPSARLSALRLAEWFVSNWWRLIAEPESSSYSWRASHKVGNAGHGYVWPDLSFSSDWHSVRVSNRPTSRSDLEPIRYLNHFDVFVPIADFEEGVTNFIAGTIARLSSADCSSAELGELWSEVLEERNNPEAAAWRTLEACMGFDPDEAPTSLIESLRELTSRYGANAIHEMATAHKIRASSLIETLRQDAVSSGITIDVPQCEDIRNRLVELDHLEIPWMKAEGAAQIAREVWRLEAPIGIEELSDLFGLPRDRIMDGRSSNATSHTAGFRASATSDQLQTSLTSRYGTSRRFALARLVADHVATTEGEKLLPVTSSWTSRQKFQRAFAQEFLCPFGALEEYIGQGMPSRDKVNEAAEHFSVSPLMIHTTLVNKGVLDRETLLNWD